MKTMKRLSERRNRDDPQQRRIAKLNEQELEAGVSEAGSWHNDYKDTAFVFIGSLPFNLTEGDILAIFSQYGNPVFIDLMRDKDTGKSKGFAFLKYEDQRSTVLAVDNLDGATVLGRTIRVDHTFYKTKGDEEELQQAMSFDKPEGERKEVGDTESRVERRRNDEEREEGRERRHHHHHSSSRSSRHRDDKSYDEEREKRGEDRERRGEDRERSDRERRHHHSSRRREGETEGKDGEEERHRSREHRHRHHHDSHLRSRDVSDRDEKERSEGRSGSRTERRTEHRTERRTEDEGSRSSRDHHPSVSRRHRIDWDAEGSD